MESVRAVIVFSYEIVWDFYTGDLYHNKKQNKIIHEEVDNCFGNNQENGYKAPIRQRILCLLQSEICKEDLKY